MGKEIGIMQIPMLQITGGYARKTAIDVESGAEFIWWDIDYFAGETPDECAVSDCETLVTNGWHCLDGGELYCEEHVTIIDDLTGDDDDTDKELGRDAGTGSEGG